MIREARLNDAGKLADIYNYYVLNTTITFDLEPLLPESFETRIQYIQEKNLPWLVCEENGAVIGYALASPWKERAGYKFTVESSIYMDCNNSSKGQGTGLYKALLQTLKEKGMHAIMAGITQPNPVSVAFHEKFGFQRTGHFREVGRKFDTWLDIGYWQLIHDSENAPRKAMAL